MAHIAFPMLGKFGRLGNQLFQIATTFAHAFRHGVNYSLPLWEYSHHFQVPETRFHRSITIRGEYWEPEFRYRALPYWEGMALNGYFQAPKYWEGLEAEVRRMLTPRGECLPGYGATCTIHVRRGDYERLQEHHPLAGESYYRQAMALARKAGARKFIVCSDDIPAAKAMLGPELEYSTATEVFDLRLMASCEYNIMANSSLSWWGAYLGPDKWVVRPEKWFGPASDHPTNDLLPFQSWGVVRE